MKQFFLLAGALALSALGTQKKDSHIPPNGDYKLTAHTADGKLMYTGTLSLRFLREEDSRFYKGKRTVKAHQEERNLNSINGTGEFEMVFHDQMGAFNLHPKYRDHNTTLAGAWTSGKFKGDWGGTTFAGYKKKGTFTLVPVKGKS